MILFLWKDLSCFPTMGVWKYFLAVKHYQGLRTGFVAHISGLRVALTRLLEAFPFLRLFFCKCSVIIISDSVFGGRVVTSARHVRFLNKICENTYGVNLIKKQCCLLCLYDKEIKCTGEAQILWEKKNQDYKKGIQRLSQLLTAN